MGITWQRLLVSLPLHTTQPSAQHLDSLANETFSKLGLKMRFNGTGTNPANQSVRRLKIDVDDMIVKMAGADPSKLLRLHLVKQQLATIDHTPFHPVYPVMIREAITDLNEDSGSTKDAISRFIMGKYDVLPVVHPAKLIEQLEKLVKEEEIVFTSENSYMLPVKNAGFLVKLNLGKKSKRGQRTNKLWKVQEGNEIHEAQNVMIHRQNQSQIEELNGPPGFKIKSCEGQDHLQEEEISEKPMGLEMIEEGFRQHFDGVDDKKHAEEIETPIGYIDANELKVTEVELEAQRETKTTKELCELAPLETKESERDLLEVQMASEEKGLDSECPGSEEIKGDLQEEQTVSEERQLDMSFKGPSQVNQGWQGVIEREVCRKIIEGVDNQRHVKEIQDMAEQTEFTEEPSQLQLQAPKVIQDQVEVLHQIKVTEALCHLEHPESKEVKDETQPQVPNSLPTEEHSQLERNHIDTIEMHIETKRQEQEVEVTEAQRLQELHNEVKNKTNGIRNMCELCIKNREESEAMGTTPVSPNTSQNSLLVLKEKYVKLLKMTKTIEQELRTVIDNLGAIEVSNHNVPHQTSGEVPTMPESEPRIASHSVYAPTVAMQLVQNKQIEHPNLKRTAELEITALDESFQKQKKKVKPCIQEKEDKYGLNSVGLSSDLLVVDSERVQMEKQQDLSTSEGHFELCGMRKQSRSHIIAGSPNAPMELPNFDLKQQSEHPTVIIEDLHASLNFERVEQEHQSDLSRSKMGLEKTLSNAEEDVTALIDLEHVEYEQQFDSQISETSHNFDPELPYKERPQGLEPRVEKLSQEGLQQVILCDKAEKPEIQLQEEQLLETSAKEKFMELEAMAVEQKYRIKQHMSRQQLEHKMHEDEMMVEEQCPTKAQMPSQQTQPWVQGPSEHESCVATANNYPQLRNIEMVQEPKLMIAVDELSKERVRGQGKQIQGDLLRRQLLLQGPRPSESDPAHATVASDICPSLALIKGKEHFLPPRCKEPQEQRSKGVEELSQLVNQGGNNHTEQKQLRSQLAAITSGEFRSVGSPVQFKTATAGGCVQTWQDQQPSDDICAFSQTEQIVDKSMAEPFPSKHCNEQKGKQKHRGRGRPPLQKSDGGTSKGKLLCLKGRNHHEQPSGIRGRGRHKGKTVAELTIREPVSEHLVGQRFKSEGGQPPQIQVRGRPPSKTSSKLTLREPLSDHLGHDERQPEQRGRGRHRKLEKRGRGRRPKLSLATGETVEVFLPFRVRSPGSPLGSNSTSARTTVTLLPSNNDDLLPQVAGKGRVTRARAAASTS